MRDKDVVAFWTELNEIELWADSLGGPAIEGQDHLRRAVVVAIFTTYRRMFDKKHRRSVKNGKHGLQFPVDPESLPEEHKETHEYLMNCAHTWVAHLGGKYEVIEAETDEGYSVVYHTRPDLYTDPILGEPLKSLIDYWLSCPELEMTASFIWKG